MDRLIAKREIDHNGCWVPSGVKNRNKHQTMSLNNKTVYLHVVAMQIFKPEEKGSQVNHTCDVRACFNPEHLYYGTQKQNMQDARDRNRWISRNKDITKCKFGHLFTDENTYVNPNSGFRSCRTCRRTRRACGEE
jgi:hypothetical protein